MEVVGIKAFVPILGSRFTKVGEGLLAVSFREAEAMQAESQPQYLRLYSVQGYRYCDLLLGPVGGHGAELEDGSGVGQAVPADSYGRHSLPYKKTCEQVRERALYAIERAAPG